MIYSLLLILSLLIIPQSAECKGKIRGQEDINLNYKVVDMVMSKNNLYVYVLSDDGYVHIYKQGWVEVASLKIGSNFKKIATTDTNDELFAIDKEGKLKVIRISFQREIDTSNSPFKGNPNAPVEIVVFSDFQCPYCATVKQTLESILRRFPDKIKIVFKHCPLGYHNNAVEAAQAAVAAGIQGKFWEFHDLLFENQKDLSPQKIMEIAEALGLDMEKFKKDKTSPQVTAVISRDVNQAKALEIRGVPAVFINGEPQDNTKEESLSKEIEEKIRLLSDHKR